MRGGGSGDQQLPPLGGAADAAGFQVIDAFSRIVRLGEGLDSSGRLAPDAMGRTLSALRICAGKMRRRGVDASRAVATEACRRADNFDAFRRRVRDEVGPCAGSDQQ